MVKMRCPVPGCGKEYEDQPGLPADTRLSHHLTGKHCLKGDEYWAAMAQAYKELMERKTT